MMGNLKEKQKNLVLITLAKMSLMLWLKLLRLEKLKAAGIYSEGFVQAADLYKAASTDNYDLDTNLDEAMTGDRTKGVEVVKTIEQLRKTSKKKVLVLLTLNKLSRVMKMQM